ncbi:MAG: hypothetical protein ACTSXT_03090 [Candidatus Helarchaeota archaeon]
MSFADKNEKCLFLSLESQSKIMGGVLSENKQDLNKFNDNRSPRKQADRDSLFKF